MSEGNTSFAVATLSTVACSLLLQIALVYLQGRKRGAKRVFFESLIVLTSLKPAVDAYRVICGEEHADDLIDPLKELIISKMAEM